MNRSTECWINDRTKTWVRDGIWCQEYCMFNEVGRICRSSVQDHLSCGTHFAAAGTFSIASGSAMGSRGGFQTGV